MIKIHKMLSVALVAFMAAAMPATAQNLSSAKNMSRMHANLLAKQQRIQDQIRLEEAQKYASDLFEEVEPEPDIYTEGWNSGLVNPFKESDVPNSRVINVRNYVMPLKNIRLTSHYGYRPKFGRNHKGVDFGCPMGDTVRAVFSGRVRLTKFERSGFGFYVIVRHENGLETVYGHLSRFLVQPEQYVKAGQPIALSGNTGRSTGPHLHFETRFMGYAINPEAIFDFNNRVTHTDTYTFNKSNYSQARNYSPSRRYSAVREQNSSQSQAQASTQQDEEKSSYTSRYSRERGKNKLSRSERKREKASRSTYKIREGDNLGKIAARNGITVAQLKKLNGLKGDKIQKGKVLKVR